MEQEKKELTTENQALKVEIEKLKEGLGKLADTRTIKKQMEEL